jgi:hypothetical protein
MNTAPAIESFETFGRVESVATIASQQDIPCQIIRNGWHEPLATVFEAAVDQKLLQSINDAAKSREHRVDWRAAEATSQILPMDLHSGLPLPLDILRLFDVVVQGASGNSNMAATRLKTIARGPWQGNSYTHTDYPGARENHSENPIQDVNVYLQSAGYSQARFAQVRNWKSVADIATIVDDGYEVMKIASRGDKKIPKMAIDACIHFFADRNPQFNFSPWIQLKPGDAVAWQAGSQFPNYLPVLHQFTARSSDRTFMPFKPEASNADEVLMLRKQLIGQLVSSGLLTLQDG